MQVRLLNSAFVLSLLASCAAPPAAKETPMAGRQGEDAIRLTNGEVIRGRILEETPRQVVIERETQVSSYPRAAIYGIDYSKDRYQERTERLRPAEEAAGVARPAPTWLPRRHPSEPVQQTEVLFFDSHPLAECVGPALAKAHQDLPDLRLFVEPGGRIVLHDPRQWGYHAHLPGAGLRIPLGKPGLSIDVPREEAKIPESITFVSPAQEIKAGDGEGRTSYALPDSIHAVVKPASVAEGMLAVQPFSGGKAGPTPNGRMWAFALPRNSKQFFVYLFDPQRKHGEILTAAFVGYGDTILAADLMIDVAGADGVTLGRVLLVPYPDNVSADGPAPEAVRIYAGPTHDPTTIAHVALPPREALQLPSKTPSTKADVLVSHYDVSANVPQGLVLAHGAGRPTKDVALVARDLTPAEPDQIVKIDLSSLPEERFPAVVWLYQRRTFAWKTTGGYLPPAPPAAVPPANDVKLVKVKKSEGIPHVLPLVFVGPRPQIASPRAVDPAAGVAGGMSGALLRDALMREAGSAANHLTANLAPNPGPVTGGGGGGEAGGVSNITYVYITSPPHTPAPDSGILAGSTAGGPYGQHLSTYGAPTTGLLRMTPATGSAFRTMGPIGHHDAQSGVYRDPQGTVTYDPRTGQSSNPSLGGSNIDGMGFDVVSGTPVINFSRRRNP